jgi:hypothetical protein
MTAELYLDHKGISRATLFTYNTIDSPGTTQQRSVDISMTNYIDKALIKFRHLPHVRPQHSQHVPPCYDDAPTQLTAPVGTSVSLTAAGLTRLQEVILGTLLYYTLRAIDFTPCSLPSPPLKHKELKPQPKPSPCATHPDAVVHYDAACTSTSTATPPTFPKRKPRSRGAGFTFFLRTQPANQPQHCGRPNATHPRLTAEPFTYTNCSIMRSVLSSAIEAELGALPCSSMPETALCYPQPDSPIQIDNACAYGIANDTVKQRSSKAIDWRKDYIYCISLQNYVLSCPNELTQGPLSIIQNCTVGRPFRSLTMRSVVQIFTTVETSIGIMIGSIACQVEWKASVRKRTVKE